MAIRLIIFVFLICGLLFTLSVFISDVIKMIGFPTEHGISNMIVSYIEGYNLFIRL
jgi:hypothetical protein